MRSRGIFYEHVKHNNPGRPGLPGLRAGFVDRQKRIQRLPLWSEIVGGSVETDVPPLTDGKDHEGGSIRLQAGSRPPERLSGMGEGYGMSTMNTNKAGGQSLAVVHAARWLSLTGSRSPFPVPPAPNDGERIAAPLRHWGPSPLNSAPRLPLWS